MVNFSKRIEDMHVSTQAVRGLFGSMSDPQVISFGGGAPASEGLPVDELREVVQEVIRTDVLGTYALQYNKIQGIVELREEVVKHFLIPKGISATADDVMIGVGGLEGLSLPAMAVIDPGDVILVEDPTFLHAISTFEMTGAKCVPVPTDDNGMITDGLEKWIKKYHPKMIYVTPTFKNPTGRTMPIERRKRLAELGSEYDVLILEDDPYDEVRYSGEMLPPIKTFDRTGNTVYANSFSKIIAPGLRLGFVVAEPSLMSCLQDVKSALNSHTSTFVQVVIAEYLKRGLYPEHIKKVCDIHRERRDVMLACIEEFFPKGVKYSRPDGGLYVWVELPEDCGINTVAMLPEAQEKFKVAYVAGPSFFVEPGKGNNCMRISFSKTTPEQIRIGMKRLGELIASKIQG